MNSNNENASIPSSNDKNNELSSLKNTIEKKHSEDRNHWPLITHLHSNINDYNRFNLDEKFDFPLKERKPVVTTGIKQKSVSNNDNETLKIQFKTAKQQETIGVKFKNNINTTTNTTAAVSFSSGSRPTNTIPMSNINPLRSSRTSSDISNVELPAPLWARMTRRKRRPSRHRYVKVLGRNDFVNNAISTAKYNLFSFLPKFLFEQFRKYANIFFLFIALMQQIPNVSPTGRYTTLVPLLIIISLSALKEIFEDIKRHRASHKINHSTTQVFKRQLNKFVKTKWKDIRVGDLVYMKKNQFFPADMLLFTSDQPSGVCFVETVNLDGETNLKARSSLAVTDQLCSIVDTNGMKKVNENNFTMKQFTIQCDLPNRELYDFVGKLTMDDQQEYPITPENILLRGAKLRNTEWIVGCVIYTGHDTKIMMNSIKKTLPKHSNVEKMINRQILSLLGILIVVCLISAICSLMWIKQSADHWYIRELQLHSASSFFLILLTFIILYNNLIPISLQVTLEMVRFIQAHFINNDLEMYCEESDTPAMARTSNLNDELGQVRYIFSDKTGTITRNIMEFKKCSINGNIYDEHSFENLSKMLRKEMDKGKEKEKHNNQVIREFWTLLAVCHTVIPEPLPSSLENRLTYQGSSPDEVALAKGAQKFGFEFIQRTPSTVVFNVFNKRQIYEILNILPFNSERKRMSTIVRTTSGEIKIYTKGADSIIQQRLCKDSLKDFNKTENNLGIFATEGLRTLCCAYANIDEDKYNHWEKRYKKALLMPASSPEQRNQRDTSISELMSEIESDLYLLGATAIEDKLQDGVPETIQLLMKAGINIWMLTGDKLETATNISYSCGLLENLQMLESYHIIKANTLDDTREALVMAQKKLANSSENFSLVIDSKSLSHCLLPDLRQTFIEIGLKCRSVICCRVSPSQKAEIVDAVKSSTNEITLAIGDGANDVAMIKAANVGVGISGHEGLQAVNSSDYSIAQFRFLARLLLVHGSWSFSRVCKLIFYSFYKNIALYVIELWFAAVSAWSGQAVFERWTIGLYNVLFTAAQPLAIGLFDRVCSAELMLNNPQLYQEQSHVFSIKLFWFWIASAIWHSLVLFWMTYFAVNHDALWAHGRSDGYYLCFGNILYTYVVVTVTLKAALEMNCWTIPSHVAVWGSIVAWFLFLIFYSRVWPTLPVGSDISGIDSMIFSTNIFWLGLAIIPFCALFIDIVVKLVIRTCFKSLADRIIELELAKKMDQPPATFTERARLLINTFIPFSREPPAKNQPLIKSTPSNEAERNALHGYSFSQEDQDNFSAHSKVIRMYNSKIS